jgi:hypothetical protein
LSLAPQRKVPSPILNQAVQQHIGQHLFRAVFLNEHKEIWNDTWPAIMKLGLEELAKEGTPDSREELARILGQCWMPFCARYEEVTDGKNAWDCTFERAKDACPAGWRVERPSRLARPGDPTAAKDGTIARVLPDDGQEHAIVSDVLCPNFRIAGPDDTSFPCGAIVVGKAG